VHVLPLPGVVLTADVAEQVLELLFAGMEHLQPDAGQGHAVHEVLVEQLSLEWRTRIFQSS